MSDELKYGIIICGIIFLLLTIVIIVISLRKKKKNKENSEFPELLEALGGFSNISNVTLNGSRVSINFEDKKNINKDKIKECGVETIVISNKKITLVVGDNASNIYNYLKNKKEA